VIRPACVVISGKIGAGKTTLAAGLSTMTGWRLLSAGDTVREKVRQLGLPELRETLQDVGAEWVERDVTGFCKALLRHDNRATEGVVIDGVRHISVLDSLTNLLAPLPVITVCVTVSEELRFKRLENREGVNAKHLQQFEGHPAERHVSRLCEGADIIVTNNSTPAEMVSRTYSCLEDISARLD
jgi:dephospho-CoA kinase